MSLAVMRLMIDLGPRPAMGNPKEVLTPEIDSSTDMRCLQCGSRQWIAVLTG